MPAGRSGASGEGPGRWWGEDAGDPSRPELPPGPEALPPAPARTPGRGRLVPDDCAGRKPPGRWLPWKTRLSGDASQFAGVTADAAEQMYSREHASHSGRRTEAPRAAAPLRRLPPPAFLPNFTTYMFCFTFRY